MGGRLFNIDGWPDSGDLPTLSAVECRERIHEGGDIALLDVRLPEEFAYCRIPDALLIPLHELESRLSELDPSKATIVYCHHGVRSARAVQILIAAGFREVYNLGGGIEEWSREVDPSVPRY